MISERNSRLALWACALLGGLLLLIIATVPLAPMPQAIFGGLTAVTFLIANRFGGKTVTFALIALSIAVSLRYLFWRLTESLRFDTTAALWLGSGLLLSELYATAVLFMDYAQTAWPLQRKVKSLPDPAHWPRVDVFITTYNEPVGVVRATMLAAMAMDWPSDRLRVWLLDDGRREELRRFAEQIGCGYITRADNRHAKAGNLNNALRSTSGAFVAVFDCDHIPTRAFLQLTMGWLVAEPTLALVQTPHHFYAPDPFQRNLAAGARVPAESNLFHGLTQDGRDTWNAAIFSGSCAVLRRAALDEIGGFATETVTEDAHTSLKLHRAGWSSAYLRLPLAAGLGTERLASHLRQRLRWARGMLQMLRLDNPLFGAGLSLGQRFCYLQAAAHYLFALPRVVFLTAPLAFLLLGQNIIAASPLAITAYALPHIFHALATNARLHRNWRHSFWSEIYETVLALFLVRVTIATLLSPRRGKFDVTAKGGLLEHGTFDLRAVYPNVVLAVLLVAGLARGVIDLTAFGNPPLAHQALVMNMVWAALSLLTVLAAIAVGRETRRVRARASVAAALPISLHLQDGTMVAATTTRLSQDGGHIIADSAVPQNADVDAVFALATGPVSMPAHVLRADASGVVLQWEPRTLEQESQVIQAVFGRADAWSGWASDPVDRPLLSLGRVLLSIGGLFRARVRTRVTTAVALAVAALLLANPAHADSNRNQSKAAVRPLPEPPIPLPNVTVPPADTAPGGLPAEPVPLPPPAAAAPASDATPPAVPAPPAPDNSRHVVLSLRQLGALGPLAMHGTSQSQEISFGLRADEVVTAAQLSLSGAMSPALLPEFSNLTVTLNEQYVGTVPASRDQPSFTSDFAVSPVFFQDANRLGFRFAGRYTADCNDPLSDLLWATVYDNSTLTLTVQRLPPQRDLSRLPQPFFDPAVRQPLVLPMVLPQAAGDDALRASAIVASWFGAKAGFRGASFPVGTATPPQGNAVLIVVEGDGAPPAELASLPPIAGPTLAVLANPTDPLGTLLVVAGRTGAEAVAAAGALSIGNHALAGISATVEAPRFAPRAPYDAPNWIPADRPVKLGELVDAADLQSAGYSGLLHVPFHTAPDFTTWRDAPFPLHVRFRAPPGPIVDVAASRLDVGVNGIYLDTVPLGAGSQDTWMSTLTGLIGGASQRRDIRIDIPTYDLFGANDLQFYFDARPLHRADCSSVPGDLRMSVDADSTIDLSRGIRFTEMPDLGYFVNSGFPFTRMADLSATAVVLPDRPSAAELGVFLDMMGRMGATTGTATTGVTVTRPEGATAQGERDVLLIGTLGELARAERLLAGAPVRFNGDQLSVALPSPLDSLRGLFGDPAATDRERVATALSTTLGPGTAILVGGESPMVSGHSVVALLADEPGGLTTAMDALRNPDQAPLVQGDLSIMGGDHVSSYRIGSRYTVGSLPFWMWPGWLLRDQPVGLAAIAILGCVLLGLALFWLLRRRADMRDPPDDPA